MLIKTFFLNSNKNLEIKNTETIRKMNEEVFADFFNLL